jgi:hypothetical protein
MEPPIGKDRRTRSIFPESQFGTVTHPSFGGPVAGSPNGIDAAAGARRDRRGGVRESGMTVQRPTRDGPAQDGLVRDP